MELVARRARSRRTGAGFTLLETVIALSILAFGLLALSAMQIVASDFGKRGRNSTQAAAIANGQLEALQRRTWTQIAPTTWTAPTPVVTGGQRYDLSWRIVNDVAGTTRSIDVRVNWDEPKRPNRQYAVSTIRFNYEGL